MTHVREINDLYLKIKAEWLEEYQRTIPILDSLLILNAELDDINSQYNEFQRRTWDYQDDLERYLALDPESQSKSQRPEPPQQLPEHILNRRNELMEQKAKFDLELARGRELSIRRNELERESNALNEQVRQYVEAERKYQEDMQQYIVEQQLYVQYLEELENPPGNESKE